MSDAYWGEITIGGTISLKVWGRLNEAIRNDTGGIIDPPLTKFLILEDPLCINGQFREIEDICAVFRIPFQRKCGGDTPELLIYNPEDSPDFPHSYSVNADFDLMTEAQEFMELRNAMKEITFKNAPKYITDKRNLYSKYAKHILSGKDLKDFMVDILDDYLPPEIPDLPKFVVLKE